MNVHLNLFSRVQADSYYMINCVKDCTYLHCCGCYQAYELHKVQLEPYLTRRDCLATLARRQAAQHFEVLQQQQEAGHCRLPAIQLAIRESYMGGESSVFTKA